MRKSKWQIQVEGIMNNLMEILFSEKLHQTAKVFCDLGLNECTVKYGDKEFKFNCCHVIFDFLIAAYELVNVTLRENNILGEQDD